MSQSNPPTRRWRISGQVQGVGYRPFVYRLARAHGLTGWVRNCMGEVEVLAQGPEATLNAFGFGLLENAPAIAHPRIVAESSTDTPPCPDFRIRESLSRAPADIHVPPDYFTCDECLEELAAPNDRRYRYPFINCTQCGPRYTLITHLPYDRRNTSMAGFPLCPDCEREYRDPMDRRFHAEPVACPRCGPRLSYVTGRGERVEDSEGSLQHCVTALRDGLIVAVRGIGGYHLMCDAGNDTAIQRLRTHKARPHKPLAVLFPVGDGEDPLAVLRQAVDLSDAESELLRSPARPILLAHRRTRGDLSALLAPGLSELGVMLPYSPLHHLLLKDLGRPLVATSGNVSGEPVLTHPGDAERRLARVAEAFLHHDRPIMRPADDSVYRTLGGRPRPLRLGRGCAPLELELAMELRHPILAVGAHMKNTVALAWGNRIVISPHIGDMGSARSLEVFEQVTKDLQDLYGVEAEGVLCDAHPGYATSRWARSSGLPVMRVLHHHAHASALVGSMPPHRSGWLVFTWDGVGYGADHSLWGGEALWGGPGGWQRLAHMRPFHLPGGDRAGREPWRSALGICWESGLAWSGAPADMGLLKQACARGLNCPRTSAVGRLFDAAAAFTGVARSVSFEGQGPMLLEARCNMDVEAPRLPLEEGTDNCLQWDWEPLVPRLMDNSIGVEARSGLLHRALAQVIRDQALAIKERRPVRRVGLAGGVFQNRVLTDLATELLEEAGFEAWLPQGVPVNDAGICLGQVVEYGAREAP